MFDLVFITHYPSFYKVNLYNALSKNLRVAVIFVASKSLIRAQDFMGDNYLFQPYFLSDSCFEKRNKIKTTIKLARTLKGLHFKHLFLGGWECPEFWVALLMSAKSKTSLILESSIFESQVDGLKAVIKRIYLSRCKAVIASGSPHQELVQKLGFKGNIRISEGVGIIPQQHTCKRPTARAFCGKFLFVGRLSAEKNLLLLVQAMAYLPQFTLTVVGQGVQESLLKQHANKNIEFISHIPNSEITNLYSQHDCLILPSLQEPWGLVVEEAIHCGLPVIVSNRVGCHIDLVQKFHLGAVFDPFNVTSLVQAMNVMQRKFTEYSNNCSQYDFAARDRHQLQQYTFA